MKKAAGGLRRFLRRAVRAALLLFLIYWVAGFITLRLRPDPSLAGASPESEGIRPLEAVIRLPETEEGSPIEPSAAPRTPGFEVLGVLSVHTGLSHDAEGSRAQVAAAARSAGLDFVFLGDHAGDWVRLPDPSPTDRTDGVLLVGGQELVIEGAGRVLVTGIDTLPPRRWDEGLASFAARLDSTGGFAAVVHPRSPRGREAWEGVERATIPAWEVFDVSEMARLRQKDRWVGYHLLALLGGIITNAGQEQLLRLNREGFEGAAVQAYDSARAMGPLTATGALNHHPKAEWRGILFPRYEPFFRTVVNHVVLDGPLADDPLEAREQISEAVRAGRVHISLGAAEAATGFRIRGESGDRLIESGGRTGWSRGARVDVLLPHGAPGRMRLRLVMNGVPLGGAVAHPGERVSWPAPGPGIYRVEVYRSGPRLGRWVWNLRPWIFSNPVEFTEEP